MATPISNYSPNRVSFTSSSDMSANVRKVIDEINNEKKLKAKQESAQIEGFAVVGASIGTLLAFIFLEPEDAVKILLLEIAAFSVYGVVTNSEQMPKIEPTPVK